MISQSASGKSLNKPIGDDASNYGNIIGSLIDRIECGISCVKNVLITHNGGRHCILVRDLSMDSALGARIDLVIKRFNRMKNIDIVVSRDDVTKEERFNYSYIVVIRQGMVKAELP